MAHSISSEASLLTERMTTLYNKALNIRTEVANRIKAYMPEGTTITFRAPSYKKAHRGVVVGFRGWDRVMVKLLDAPEVDDFIIELIPFDTRQVTILGIERGGKNSLPQIREVTTNDSH